MAVDELIDLVRIEEPSFYENPVPIYQRLQQEAPVFYYAPLDLFILTKHEDIRFAAQRKDIFSPTGGLLLTEIMHSAESHCAKSSSIRPERCFLTPTHRATGSFGGC
jgi:hypothetical protein